MKINKKYILSIALFAGAAMGMSGARPIVKMSVDSSAILMGKTASLHLTVNDANATEASQLILRPDSAAMEKNKEAASGLVELTPGVEVVEGYDNPTLTKDEAGANILESIIKIQSFDSGDYIIPGIVYTNGRDTVQSNSIALRVFPVDSVTAESDLMPMSGIMPPYNRKLVDYLPDWLIDNWLFIVIALVIIAGGICAYLILTKRVKIRILPQKKQTPPYEMAVGKLEQLRKEQLCEQGMYKEYYTRLTDILREYLDRRFGINAMEMTSTQIRAALKSSRDEIMSKELVAHVLEIADFVKFAKATPLGDDNIRAYKSALQFVEDTKPVEATEEDRKATAAPGNSAEEVEKKSGSEVAGNAKPENAEKAGGGK